MYMGDDMRKLSQEEYEKRVFEAHLIRVKYHRSQNPMIFRNKITERLKQSLLDMGIPSQAYEETLGRCND